MFSWLCPVRRPSHGRPVLRLRAVAVRCRGGARVAIRLLLAVVGCRRRRRARWAGRVAVVGHCPFVLCGSSAFETLSIRRARAGSLCCGLISGLISEPHRPVSSSGAECCVRSSRRCRSSLAHGFARRQRIQLASDQTRVLLPRLQIDRGRSYTREDALGRSRDLLSTAATGFFCRPPITSSRL